MIDLLVIPGEAAPSLLCVTSAPMSRLSPPRDRSNSTRSLSGFRRADVMSDMAGSAVVAADEQDGQSRASELGVAAAMRQLKYGTGEIWRLSNP